MKRVEVECVGLKKNELPYKCLIILSSVYFTYIKFTNRKTGKENKPVLTEA